MSEITDIELMQLADGEGLDPARRIEIETALSADPALRARHSAFEATGRAAIGRPLDSLLAQPAPQALVAAIRAAPAPAANEAKPIVQSAPRQEPAMGRVKAFLSELFTGGAGLALAMLVLIAVMLGPALFGLVAARQPGAELFAVTGGKTRAAGALASALDTAPSGATIASGPPEAQTTIRPVLSFATGDGAVCRQFDAALPSGDGIGGLACRDSEGWRIMVHAGQTKRNDAGEVTRPAGAAEQPMAVDEVVDRLKSRNVMTLAQEKAAMVAGWKVEPQQPKK